MGVWRGRIAAAGVSGALHAVGVGGAMLLVFASPGGEREAVADDGRERASSVSFFVPAFEESPVEVPVETAPAGDVAPVEVDAIDAALESLLESPDVGGDVSLADAFAPGGEDGFGDGGGGVVWDAGAIAVPATVTLAGSTASGANDVVYVVDASGSMVSAMPMVRDVLARSMDELRATQRFAVVFITSDGARAFPERLASVGLARATRENLALARAWASGVRAGGLGNPLPALEAALRASPDAVFVLSKGIEPPAGVEPSEEAILAALDALNPVRADGTRRVVINAVQVIDEDRADALWSMAQVHGEGDEAYRFVSREELAAYAKGVAP